MPLGEVVHLNKVPPYEVPLNMVHPDEVPLDVVPLVMRSPWKRCLWTWCPWRRWCTLTRCLP